MGALLAAALACPGPAGPQGDKGETGPTGPKGDPGNSASARPGQACWDLNNNGQADLATEDRNSDGVVNVGDCSGTNGSNGTSGPRGRDCWDLNGNGSADVAAEDLNGDGQVDVEDCQGLAIATLTVIPFDVRSGSLLAAVGTAVTAATVSLDPPAVEPQTVDASGRVVFRDLPVGVYTITASAIGLSVSSTGVRQTGVRVDSIPIDVSLVAGAQETIRVPVARLPEDLNTLVLHSQPLAGTGLWNDAACQACHGTRQDERAAGDSLVAAWHSIRLAGALVHANNNCLNCHDANMDTLQETGAAVRKYVAVTKCTLCHPKFPCIKQDSNNPLCL